MAEKKVVLRLKLKDPGSPRPRISEVATPKVVTEWNYPRIAGTLAVIVLIVSGLLVWSLSTEDDEVIGPVKDPELASTTTLMPGEPKPKEPKQIAEQKPGWRIDKPQQPAGAEQGEVKTDVASSSSPEDVSAKAEKIDVAESVRVETDDEKSDVAEAEIEVVSAKAQEAPGEPVALAEKADERAAAPAVRAGWTTKKKILGEGIVRAKLSRGIWQREPFGEVISPVKAEPDRAIGLFLFTEFEGAPGERFFHQWLRDGKLVFEQPVKLRADKNRFYTSKLLNANMLGQWEVRVKDAQGKILYREHFELVGP